MGEHPVIYVIFKSDEHMFREDDIVDDSEKKQSEEDQKVSEADVEKPKNIGDVMDQADAMQADPEAYKQYFDFYLKYYTSKYAQQGVDLSKPDAPPNLMAPPAQFPNTSSNTFPNRAQFLNNTFPQRPQHTTNTNSVFQNINKYPNRSCRKDGLFHYNPQVMKKVSPSPSNFYATDISKKEEINRNNIESAKRIKDDLKTEFVNPIGGLVACDDSDSD